MSVSIQDDSNLSSSQTHWSGQKDSVNGTQDSTLISVTNIAIFLILPRYMIG